MRTFSDAAGRTWQVFITLGTLKRIKALANVDLLATITSNAEALADPVLLADVLYAVCEPQAKHHNISPSDFADALTGDVLEEAIQALLHGIIDFFPRTANVQKLHELLELEYHMRRQEAKTAGETIDAQIAELRTKLANASHGNLQESSG